MRSYLNIFKLYPLAWAISRALCPVAASLMFFFLLAVTDGFTSLIDWNVLILFLWIMSDISWFAQKIFFWIHCTTEGLIIKHSTYPSSLLSHDFLRYDIVELFLCCYCDLKQFSYSSLYYVMSRILDYLAFVSASLNTWLTVGSW